MKILHVVTDQALVNIESVVAEKKGIYQQITKSEWLKFKDPFDGFHLIVIECEQMTQDCEERITWIMEQSSKRCSIILVSDIADFWTESKCLIRAL